MKATRRGQRERERHSNQPQWRGNIQYLHMKPAPWKPLRDSKKEQETVRSIEMLDETRFHNEFEALTMWQPTKLQRKYINCEVQVMNETRMSKMDDVVMLKWPYLAIVRGCGWWCALCEKCFLNVGCHYCSQNFTPIILCTRIYVK
jgi:hypothetical protein